MTFRLDADACAIAWKLASLPSEAHIPSVYGARPREPHEFCVPVEHAALNLLPDARAIALNRFERYRIHWHDGVGSGPSNHLMDSQVACVNALAPHIHSPDAIRWLFQPVLDIAEVLPFADPSPPADYVAFEWVGLVDHLGERPGMPLSRGANMTSADAAIRYRTSAGDTEIALIEWKFVEQYGRGRKLTKPESNAKRMKTYGSMLGDAACPVVDIEPEHFLTEPLYQLARQQLLAWRMQVAHELGADRVRVVEAAPAANAALWRSVPPALGDDLRVVFPTLLRDDTSWVHLDTARWLLPESPSSADFKTRYAVLAG